MPLYAQSRKLLSLGVGMDFLLPHHITPGIAYQGTLGWARPATNPITDDNGAGKFWLLIDLKRAGVNRCGYPHDLFSTSDAMPMQFGMT